LAILILLILAAAWAAFFLWPVINGRNDRHRVDSIDRFTQHLRVIGRTGGYGGVPPVARRAGGGAAGRPGAAVGPGTRRVAAAKRRRDVLLVLSTATAGLLLLALVAGGVLLWAATVLAALLLGVYLVLLAVVGRTADRVAPPVPLLGARPSRPAAVPVPLRRTASS